MRTLLTIVASALFLAAIVTELTTRLWPGDHLALFIVGAITLALNGLFVLKVAPGNPASAAEPQSARRPEAAAGSNTGNRNTRSEPRERKERPESRAATENVQTSGEREAGTVKWFNRSKGFGFIVRDNGEEIFVHQRSIVSVEDGDHRRRPALRDGQSVTFVVAVRDKGAQAEDVKPAD